MEIHYLFIFGKMSVPSKLQEGVGERNGQSKGVNYAFKQVRDFFFLKKAAKQPRKCLFLLKTDASHKNI